MKAFAQERPPEGVTSSYFASVVLALVFLLAVWVDHVYRI